MNEKYVHKYYDPSDLTKYKVCEYIAGIEMREVSEDYYLYQEWIKTNTPEKVSGSRFIRIVDGLPITVPDMESTLAKEKQTVVDEQIRQQLRDLDWKILRFVEQKELVSKGKLEKNKLTDEEYLALLEQRQALRDQVSDK